MRRITNLLEPMNRTRLLVCGVTVLVLAMAASTVKAGPKDDLESRRNDWKSIVSRMEDMSKRVDDYLEQSKKLREVDKTELEKLIAQICGLDIERDNDEGDQTAKSISDKVVDTVRRDYDSFSAVADKVESDAEKLLGDAKAVREATKDLRSNDEIKDDVDKFLTEMSEGIDRFTERVWQKLNTDYKTLDNVKNGVMKGTNNPKIRAAVEYGKEKHVYNQRICDEKEVVLPSGGRPDCVSFLKDNCAVWEFKPDSTFNDSSAADYARKYYLDEVIAKFKDDDRAKANCKKDSNNVPIFEAKGAVYPACNLKSFGD
jgi:cytochrome c556